MERTMMSHGLVAVLTAAAVVCAQPVVAQERPALAQAASLQGFSVVLVIGDTQEGQSSDELPAAARRTLADMKDFLPYKTYRLVDSGWMMGSLPVRSATTRMRGPNNRDLDVALIANAAVPSGMNVKFSLIDSAGATDAKADIVAEQVRELELEHGRLQREIAAREKEGPRNSEALLNARIRFDEIGRMLATLREGRTRPGGSAARVIDTTFNMAVGETVVVGTSRMQGSTALIALLTAVPRGAK